MENLWDIKRLSQYLGVKRSTLYSMIERKEIPHYRIGRLARFSPTEIDQWLLSRKCHDEQKSENRGAHRKRCSSSCFPKDIVKAAIDELNPGRYNRSGKSDRIKGLRKEG